MKRIGGPDVLLGTNSQESMNQTCTIAKQKPALESVLLRIFFLYLHAFAALRREPAMCWRAISHCCLFAVATDSRLRRHAATM